MIMICFLFDFCECIHHFPFFSPHSNKMANNLVAEPIYDKQYFIIIEQLKIGNKNRIANFWKTFLLSTERQPVLLYIVDLSVFWSVKRMNYAIGKANQGKEKQKKNMEWVKHILKTAFFRRIFFFSILNWNLCFSTLLLFPSISRLRCLAVLTMRGKWFIRLISKVVGEKKGELCVQFSLWFISFYCFRTAFFRFYWLAYDIMEFDEHLNVVLTISSELGGLRKICSQ